MVGLPAEGGRALAEWRDGAAEDLTTAGKRRRIAPDEFAVIARLANRYAHLAGAERDLAELDRLRAEVGRQQAAPPPHPAPVPEDLRPVTVAELLSLHQRGLLTHREARAWLGLEEPRIWPWRRTPRRAAPPARPRRLPIEVPVLPGNALHTQGHRLARAGWGMTWRGLVVLGGVILGIVLPAPVLLVLGVPTLGFLAIGLRVGWWHRHGWVGTAWRLVLALALLVVFPFLPMPAGPMMLALGVTAMLAVLVWDGVLPLART